MSRFRLECLAHLPQLPSLPERRMVRPGTLQLVARGTWSPTKRLVPRPASQRHRCRLRGRSGRFQACDQCRSGCLKFGVGRNNDEAAYLAQQLVTRKCRQYLLPVEQSSGRSRRKGQLRPQNLMRPMHQKDLKLRRLDRRWRCRLKRRCNQMSCPKVRYKVQIVM